MTYVSSSPLEVNQRFLLGLQHETVLFSLDEIGGSMVAITANLFIDTMKGLCQSSNASDCQPQSLIFFFIL